MTRDTCDMREYSIRIDGVVLGHGFVYRSRKEAEDMIRKMADADRVYDIPDSPKRVVVERDVSPWRTSRTKTKKETE